MPSWLTPTKPNKPTKIQFHHASGNSVKRPPIPDTFDGANRIGNADDVRPPEFPATNGEPLASGRLSAVPLTSIDANRTAIATGARPIREGSSTLWKNIQT